MVRMELCRLDSGSPMMRSMAICWNGRAAGSVGILYIGGRVRWVMILFCWHVAHPWTYSAIQARMSGHQYFRCVWAMVLSCLGCPVMRPSCTTLMISRLSVRFGGTASFPSFLHPEISPCGGFNRLTVVIPYCFSQSFIRGL